MYRLHCASESGLLLSSHHREEYSYAVVISSSFSFPVSLLGSWVAALFMVGKKVFLAARSKQLRIIKGKGDALSMQRQEAYRI